LILTKKNVKTYIKKTFTILNFKRKMNSILLKKNTLVFDLLFKRFYAPKEIKLANEARIKLIKGVDILADCVSVTLGPKGKYLDLIILEQFVKKIG